MLEILIVKPPHYVLCASESILMFVREIRQTQFDLHYADTGECVRRRVEQLRRH